MLLVKPSAEIISDIFPFSILQLIERAGRTCYKSEEKISSDSAPGFAQMILGRGHESVIEHASVTVRFICDRGVSHEIVRHRLASYSQESTRYCDYSGGNVAFVIPPWCENIRPGCPPASWQMSSINAEEKQWLAAMRDAEIYYKNLRERGWRPEQARSVLPNSLKTEIVMTANLREWRHFFNLRTSAAAHPQMREVAIPLLQAMQQRIPVIFDDLTTEK